MRTSRLEAFSDGVIAIVITILVLELRAPPETSLEALRPLAPALFSYGLSFLYLAIYWINHHHLLQAAHRMSGGILWGNLHLLFWLSLIPFSTAWMNEHPSAPAPIALYGTVLLMAAVAYLMLQHLIIATEGTGSTLRRAIGADWKGKLSLLIYLTAIVLAVPSPWVSRALHVSGALMWLIPDRRIARTLRD